MYVEAGLVWGEEPFFDSTEVNADVGSLRSLAQDHPKELFEETVD